MYKNLRRGAVQILNRSLFIDEDFRAIMVENKISEETMKIIVFWANLRLKRYNRSQLSRQAVHQIALQAINNGKKKLSRRTRR